MSAYYNDAFPRHIVSGVAGEWRVYDYPVIVGATAIAGPFKTRKAAFQWLAENKDN